MQSIDNVLKLRKGLKPDDPNPDIFDVLWAKKLSGAAKNYTVTGNPISFLAKKAQTAKSTKVTLEPVQAGSGDPSPTNIRPISGRSSVEIKECGKNLFDKTTATNGYLDVNGDFVSVSTSKVSDYIMVIPNQTYYFGAWYSTTVGRYSAYYDENKNILRTFRPTISGEAITIPSGVKYVRVTMRNEFVDTYQLELGSEASTFEPYAESNDVTITFPAVGKNQFNKDDDSEILNNLYIDQSTNKMTRGSATKCIVIPCQPNTTYTISKTEGKRFTVGTTRVFPKRNVNVYGIIANSTETSITITTESQAVFLIAYVYSSSSTGDTKTWDEIVSSVQIELGSFATSYEPYTNTVYGGTLDVEKGELVVDRKIRDLGTLTWQKIAAGSSKHRFSTYVALMKPSTLQIMCSHYPRSSSTYIGNFGIQSSNNNIYIFDSDYEEASAAEFKTAMNGVQLVYELATPRTITLTPSQIQILKGQNTIWIEDEGATIELTYKK